MARRCNNGMCLLMANAKVASLDLPVANILANPRSDWSMLTHGARVRVARDIEVDWKKFNQDSFLFSHCSIVASVQVKDDGHTIIPACVELVNNNGNAWTNEVLLATFKTFIGGENFLEHVQVAELSKGKILDAVARPVEYKDEKGRKASIYYIDLLVATDRKHDDLVRKITAGEMTTMSMGCGIAGTPITMSDGKSKTIEEIGVGDSVLSHTGSSRKVTSLFKYDARDVPMHSLSYTGMTEPLSLTAEHPILVAKKNSVNCRYSSRPCRTDTTQRQCVYGAAAYSTRVGKKKPCGRDKSDYLYDIHFVPISDVMRGDYLVKTFPVGEVDDVRFTTDVCRLFGLYLSEGYAIWKWKNREKLYPLGVEFCFGMNETDLIQETKEVIGRVSPHAKVVERSVPERNGCYIKVWDKSIASLFLENGGEGAWGKSLSETVMKLPRQKQMVVISGMFDGDGCFYEKKQSLHYSTASETLCGQTHLMLLRLGIGNAYQKVWRKTSGYRVANHPEQYWQYTLYIGKNASWMVKCRKNKMFGKKPSHSSDKCFFYGNYYLCPVDSNDSVRVSARVYNFSVEEDESYLVGNMAVHNCIANEVTCSKCGKVMGDNDPNCKHLDDEMLHPYTDDDGDETVVAELCGRMIKKNGKWEGDPKSVKFIEASWVAKPAFYGAVLNHYVSEIPKEASRILAFSTARLNESVADLFRMRVADKMGMITLRVACEELARRKREAMIERIIR